MIWITHNKPAWILDQITIQHLKIYFIGIPGKIKAGLLYEMILLSDESLNIMYERNSAA